MSDEKRPSTPGPCNEYKPNGDGGCWNCVYSHREPTRSTSSSDGVRQWTVKHVNGHIDAEHTATSFGPSDDRQEALRRLEVAESDCGCRDDEDTRHHVLVTRFVPAPTYWAPDDSDRRVKSD